MTNCSKFYTCLPIYISLKCIWLPNSKDCDSGQENKRKEKRIITSNQISNFCYIPPGGNPNEPAPMPGENHSFAPFERSMGSGPAMYQGSGGGGGEIISESRWCKGKGSSSGSCQMTLLQGNDPKLAHPCGQADATEEVVPQIT